MTMEKYKIAIVGSGPGGLSAAGSAAKQKLSHILLEAAPHLSNTVFSYQKGKPVMAEPAKLPLRSAVGFEAGSREKILSVWNEGAQRLRINARCNAEVTAIAGQRHDFTLTLANSEQVRADHVVLAIGTQGNLRKISVPGEDLPFVQYQLDDPDEYEGETIVVVGAGDSAIENALALARNNSVIILNRRDEFNRAKDGNLKGILKAIDDKTIQCFYKSAPLQVQRLGGGGEDVKPGLLVIKTAEGEVEIACDRIIARLGADPPRKFLESCGIRFPNKDPAAVPAVSEEYESNVPGLYVIGDLTGPLIKRAMNQGFEVIEFIEGRKIAPADEELLRDKFKAQPGFASVNAALEMVKNMIPLLSGLTILQLREFMLDSDIRVVKRDETIFKYNDYTDSVYSILSGAVRVQLDPQNPKQQVVLRQGDFFGEASLISGRRRNVTVTAGDACVLIETPRRSMNKLINSVASVKSVIDDAFLRRAIRWQFAPEVPSEALDELVRTATLKELKAGDTLFAEGEPGDSMYLIRSGSVTVSRNIGGRECVLSYVAAGNYVGEIALLTDTVSLRSATVRAAIATEAIRIEGQPFKLLLKRLPELRHRLRARAWERIVDESVSEPSSKGEVSDLVSFLMRQGIGEATDVLLIDESLCVRCDQCEKACSETHQGVSRLDREAGPTFDFIHVPTSCRHCEHPHCMKDCPPDAIHRTPDGEVYIADNCIGCGNCERNCPYGVIRMAVKEEPKPVSLISWLLFGKGRRPGDEIAHGHHEGVQKKAIKCDMCKGLDGGPACVRACPTGAAIRVNPEEFMKVTLKAPVLQDQ
jgi:thioredoxin reductase/CRP-like cAMP-binding protein/Fe-S-cluster-containing hydrogenase component 2